MYRAGDPTKDVLGRLYLRYDCSTETLYALVDVADDIDPSYFIDADHNNDPAGEHFIKIGSGGGAPLTASELQLIGVLCVAAVGAWGGLAAFHALASGGDDE